MTEATTVLTQLDDGGVLLVTLNRPECKNAFDEAQWDSLARSLDEAREDPRVAVVVLTGAGGPWRLAAVPRRYSPEPASMHQSAAWKRCGAAIPCDLFLRLPAQVGDDVGALPHAAHTEKHALTGDEGLRVGEPGVEALSIPDNFAFTDRIRIGEIRHGPRLTAENAPVQGADAVVVEGMATSTTAAIKLLTAVGQVADGTLSSAFVATRPPGHHATPERAMGFCLINHVAVAARWLQATSRAERVLIVDWDVHHGNGTQDTFYADGTVFYLSLHQAPHYPGTGAADETGTREGKGWTLNVPLPAGTPVPKYRKHFTRALEQAPQTSTLRGGEQSPGFSSYQRSLGLQQGQHGCSHDLGLVDVGPDGVRGRLTQEPAQDRRRFGVDRGHSGTSPRSFASSRRAVPDFIVTGDRCRAVFFLAGRTT